MDQLHIESGEHVVLKIRKHWLILLRDTMGTIVVGILPFLVAFAFFAAGVSFADLLTDMAPLIVFASCTWLLLVWMTLIILWTNYYLDVWVVTDRRIFNINQIGLFNRTVSTWHLDRVQEIVIKKENFLQSLFNYGTIQVETASPTEANAVARGIPHPEHVRTVILELASKLGTLEEVLPA